MLGAEDLEGQGVAQILHKFRRGALKFFAGFRGGCAGPGQVGGGWGSKFLRGFSRGDLIFFADIFFYLLNPSVPWGELLSPL